MEWQPIETAPIDGSEILVYGPTIWEDYADEREWIDAKCAVRVAVCNDWRNDDGSLSWLTVTENPYVDLIRPTHWMPLPSPPVTPDNAALSRLSQEGHNGS